MNTLTDTDRRAPHRTDKAEDVRCAFNPQAAAERRDMLAQLDEWLADLRKTEQEQHA